MPGMDTSRRMTANSVLSRWRSAAFPLRARTRFWPSFERTASRARSLSSRSSTRRILTFRDATAPLFRGAVSLVARNGVAIGLVVRVFSMGASTVQPETEDSAQLLGVDRLGEIIRSAGGDAFLAVAFHSFGRHRDNRQFLELSE